MKQSPWWVPVECWIPLQLLQNPLLLHPNPVVTLAHTHTHTHTQSWNVSQGSKKTFTTLRKKKRVQKLCMLGHLRSGVISKHFLSLGTLKIIKKSYFEHVSKLINYQKTPIFWSQSVFYKTIPKYKCLGTLLCLKHFLLWFSLWFYLPDTRKDVFTPMPPRRCSRMFQILLVTDISQITSYRYY